jgi:Mg2+ and Co2+ transporter CorA
VTEVESKSIQTDENEEESSLSQNCDELLKDVGELKGKIIELENLLQAKDQVINNFRVVSLEPPPSSGRVSKSEASYELEESLQVARETMASLNERLKAKDENLSQYKKLLADVRAEMSSGTERHVQEMKALQMTIYQQQQAFTR